VPAVSAWWQSIPGPDPGMLWIGALLIGLAYAVRSARLSALDPRHMYWAGVCAIAGGVWGSHALVVLQNGNVDARTLARAWEGAKSFYGGVAGGTLAALLYFRLRRLPSVAYADAAIPAVALGYAIGRVGCFVNGDDFGTLSGLPWAVRYPAGTAAYVAHASRGWIEPFDAQSLPVHPTQLYSALLGLMLFIVLSRWRPPTPGWRVGIAAAGYSIVRFVLEGWRGDFQPVLASFSMPQLCSIVLLSLVTVLGLRQRWQHIHSQVAANPMQ